MAQIAGASSIGSQRKGPAITVQRGCGRTLPPPDHARHGTRQKWTGQTGRGLGCDGSLPGMPHRKLTHRQARQPIRLVFSTTRNGKIGAATRAHRGVSQTRAASGATFHG